jgi:hypothetical protein
MKIAWLQAYNQNLKLFSASLFESHKAFLGMGFISYDIAKYYATTRCSFSSHTCCKATKSNFAYFHFHQIHQTHFLIVRHTLGKSHLCNFLAPSCLDIYEAKTITDSNIDLRLLNLLIQLSDKLRSSTVNTKLTVNM